MKMKYPFIDFYALICACQPEAIFDIGSKDGKESKRFKRYLCSRAKVFAFEPNPDNFALMQNDRDLRDLEVFLSDKAVSNNNGRASFSQIEAEGINDSKSGASSLMGKQKGFQGNEIEVQTTTLDDFILDQEGKISSLCLWIDVEGHGFQVLEGALENLKNTIAIHIEVEERPLWEGQKLVGCIEDLLSKHNFEIHCEPESKNFPQYNLVFVNRELIKNWPRMMKMRYAFFRCFLIACHKLWLLKTQV